jgi:hypothetical protein
VLAERPLPKDVDRRIEALALAWSHDPDMAALYVFGSRAAGNASTRSDVDLAVVLREGLDADARWRKRLDLTVTPAVVSAPTRWMSSCSRTPPSCSDIACSRAGSWSTMRNLGGAPR